MTIREVAGGKSSALFLRFSLLFAFIFFFVIEWRWMAMLTGLPDTNPYIAAAIISVFVILTGMLTLNKRTLSFWLVLLIILYTIVVAALNVGELYGLDNYSVLTDFGGLSINLALFITASNKVFWRYVYANPKKILGALVLLVLPLFFLLFFYGAAVESHFNLRGAIWISGIVHNSKFTVSYQALGDKLSLLTFVVFSLGIGKGTKAFFFILALASLYVCGSKASMVGYIFACCAYYVARLFFIKRYVKWLLRLFFVAWLLQRLFLYSATARCKIQTTGY